MVGASTGAKNILIILDFSGSMEGSKLKEAKKASISVIDTLG